MVARTRSKVSDRRAPREGLGVLSEALRPLNERQRRFVKNLLDGKSPNEAATLAGYTYPLAVIMLRGLANVREAIHRLAPLAADPATTEAMLRPYAIEALAETLQDKKGSHHTRVAAAREVLAPTSTGRATPPALLPRTSTQDTRGEQSSAHRLREQARQRRAAARQAAGLPEPGGRSPDQVAADLAAQAGCPTEPLDSPHPADLSCPALEQP
jgi:hypothetical protein